MVPPRIHQTGLLRARGEAVQASGRRLIGSALSVLMLWVGVLTQAPNALASSQPLVFFSQGSTLWALGDDFSNAWANADDEWGDDGSVGVATGMASDGSDVFWAKGSSVYRQPIDASSQPVGVVMAASVGSGSFMIKTIDVDTQHVYLLGLDSAGSFHVARATKAGALDSTWVWTTSNLVTGSDSLEGYGISVGPDSVFVTHTVVNSGNRTGKVWKASKQSINNSPASFEEWIVESKASSTSDEPLPIANDGALLYFYSAVHDEIRGRGMSGSGSVGQFDGSLLRAGGLGDKPLDMDFDSTTGDIVFSYQREGLDPIDDPDNPSLPPVLLTYFGLVSPASPSAMTRYTPAVYWPTTDRVRGVVAAAMPASLPGISTGPISVSAAVGGAASFSVDASASDGGTLSFQWKKDGVVIAGAIGATLQIPSVSISDAGSYTVEVTNTLGSSTANVTSTAAVLTIAPPSAATISPASGSTVGGTAVTVTGLGFSSDATVDIGGVACASVVIVSSTSIECTTPVGSVGTVDVVVTNSDGQDGTLANGFTYAAPSITPVSVLIGGTAGTAIQSSPPYTATDFAGAVTYSLTSGTLPAGLSIDASTGVISGTPTAASTATVTITATGATAGTATATVTFAIAAEATATTEATTTTEATATTTEETTTTTAAPANTPTLVNETNQAALTRTPGAATALVNGVAVDVAVVSKADSPAAQTAPEDRSPEQIEELQQAAAEVVGLLDEVAGGDSGIEVVETDTGAELDGVFPDTNVPVEDVIVVDIDESATLFAARDGNGNIVEVQPGAVLEVTPEGEVAVLAYGLPAGDEVELVIMSTPTLLGTFTVDASGSIETRADMPDTIGSGDHTLVVASPNVKAALGLKIADTTSDAGDVILPATGANTATPIVIALLCLGGLLALTARRRRDLTGL